MLKSHAVAIDESNTMNHPTPQGLPVRDLTDDEKQFLHYNPNTSDLVEFVQAYAREALAAQAATLESIHKIIECAGPEAADEIADLLGYPSVEWPSDQAAPSPEQAVGAEDEPWVVFDSQGYYAWHSTEVSAKEWCEHYNARSADDPLKPYVCRRISECAALQASRQPQAQQAVAEGAGDGLRQTLIDVGRVIAWQCFGDCRAYDEFGPGSLRGLHEMDAEIRAALATPQPEPEWSPAYTRGPARQSAPVTAVPALVPLSVLQYNQIPELCQIRPSLYESVVRAIEAAIAKINGLTVGDGAQAIKDTP